jgi:hypothetical protein
MAMKPNGLIGTPLIVARCGAWLPLVRSYAWEFIALYQCPTRADGTGDASADPSE